MNVSRLEGLDLQLLSLSPGDAANHSEDLDVDLDDALSSESPAQVATGLYHVMLGRPPDVGSQAAEALAHGLSPILLAVSLLDSPEGLDLPAARRIHLLRELTRRGLRMEWGLPVTGSLVRYIIDPNVALILAGFRVGLGRAPMPDELAEGRDLLGTGLGREQYLRGIWRERGTPSRVCGPVTRNPRGALVLLMRPRRFAVFRQHVLAVETALAAQLPSLDSVVGPAEAVDTSGLSAGQAYPAQVLARVNEVASGVRRLGGSGGW